jgi:hypothetical protein
MGQINVSVYPGEAFSQHRFLMRALSELYPVNFLPAPSLDAIREPAALMFGVTRDEVVRSSRSGVRCFAFTTIPQASPCSSDSDIKFSQAAYLPQSLRDQTLVESAGQILAPLREEAGDVVLARRGADVLWLHRSDSTSTFDLAATEPPRLSQAAHLFQELAPERWTKLLPLMHFLSVVSHATGWELPGPRACFMFDDPNLHWPSYGFIHFGSLAQEAEKHNYHTAFATVPFDGWYVNKAAARIFRESKRISLLVHGNEHTRRELARHLSNRESRAMAAQSLRRIQGLERDSGLEVSRVMAAPHGACTDQTAQTLLDLGFEAACISTSAIMAYNPTHAWPLNVGLTISEFLGNGLPIIPRFRMSADCKTEVALTAFCGRAIIPTGHHWDLANGLDLLKHIASTINSLPDVKWMDLKSIARSNFATRRKGSMLDLKMYSRCISLEVPEGAKQLQVERPWLCDGKQEDIECRQLHNGRSQILRHEGTGSFQVMPGTRLEIASINPTAIDPSSVPTRLTRLPAVGRRYLCEARDRVWPLLKLLKTRKPA